MSRRLILADLNVLARALVATQAERRPTLAAHILDCASYADRYRQRMKRAHPRWGDGTVEAAARCYDLAPQTGFHDAEYSRCFAVALAALNQKRLSNDASDPLQ